ncbi:hypothetical protein O181_002535 [Austropuccinia psidii MF-1]|uniref:Uncharacterized protein n=1 Tax=Austropuccinia psidii MF-1 TaxID=1389203 RepID=A0A9Q3GCY5_9BASI|nr:hypothetical protein [Austropuccinia psidii MF-1]
MRNFILTLNCTEGDKAANEHQTAIFNQFYILSHFSIPSRAYWSSSSKREPDSSTRRQKISDLHGFPLIFKHKPKPKLGRGFRHQNLALIHKDFSRDKRIYRAIEHALLPTRRSRLHVDKFPRKQFAVSWDQGQHPSNENQLTKKIGEPARKPREGRCAMRRPTDDSQASLMAQDYKRKPQAACLMTWRSRDHPV